MNLLTTLTVLLAFCFWSTTADTPANCTYEDIKGYWIFEESEPIHDRNEDCSKVKSFPRKIQIKLDFPNEATDIHGNQGKWTIIYNQGFEVTINYRKYFAFSVYQTHGGKTISECDKVKPGWSHDVLGNNWACYKGQKVESWENSKQLSVDQRKQHEARPLLLENVNLAQELGQQQVDHINSKQKLWKAEVYPEFQQMTNEELINMAGGRASRVVNRPKPMPASEQLKKLAAGLPESFDWRDVNGINYVSPVRNQGQCGSCYIFSSMAQLESRIRIATNNTEKPIFSTQEVLDCSPYSQGCNGGFPYLISGKYAQDYGVIHDHCYPYKGRDGKCNQYKENSTDCDRRTYTVRYHYVGGFYGAGNEESMLVELVRNGPIVVGFEVYPDFANYRHGIYSHSSLESSRDKFNPFELTNHAVLVVGYGKDQESGEKYWIVKNSWGTRWGMDGYFNILRGNDECGIESLALSVTPIPY